MTETGGRRSRESLDWLVEGVLVGDATGCRAAGAPSAEGADSASTGWRDQSGLWGTNVTGCQPLQESLAAVEIAGWGRDWMHNILFWVPGGVSPRCPVLKARTRHEGVTVGQRLLESLACLVGERDWTHTYFILGAGRREPPLPCVLKVRSL